MWQAGSADIRYNRIMDGLRNKIVRIRTSLELPCDRQTNANTSIKLCTASEVAFADDG